MTLEFPNEHELKQERRAHARWAKAAELLSKENNTLRTKLALAVEALEKISKSSSGIQEQIIIATETLEILKRER